MIVGIANVPGVSHGFFMFKILRRIELQDLRHFPCKSMRMKLNLVNRPARATPQKRGLAMPAAEIGK